MIQVTINGKEVITFDERSEEAIVNAAKAISCSVESIRRAIEEVLSATTSATLTAYELGKLSETLFNNKALDYEFVDLRKEHVYCTYKSNLHKPEKRRNFKPKIYWKRTRSNPR